MTPADKWNLWRDKIERCLSSGLSNAEWCRLNRVALSTFYYWVRRFRKEEPGLFMTFNTSEWIEITKESRAARTAMVPTTKASHDLVGAVMTTIENTTPQQNPVICARINGVELSIAAGCAQKDIEAVFQAANIL